MSLVLQFLEIAFASKGQDRVPKKTSYFHVANGGWFAVVDGSMLEDDLFGLRGLRNWKEKHFGRGGIEEARSIPRLNFGPATDARLIHLNLFGNLNLDKEGWTL